MGRQRLGGELGAAVVRVCAHCTAQRAPIGMVEEGKCGFFCHETPHTFQPGGTFATHMIDSSLRYKTIVEF